MQIQSVCIDATTLMIQHSKRHHFVPQFYLRTWVDSEAGGLWLYSRDKKGRFASRLRSPKSVGYVEDLYTLRPETGYPVLDAVPDVLEKGFFSTIDECAAKVHRKLLSSGVGLLNRDERFQWALFLNSLMERNPARIRELEQSFSIDEVKNELAGRWGDSKFVERIDWTSMHRNSIRRALVSYIRDTAFIDHVVAMRWLTVTVPIEGEHLLTSDTPVLINGGGAGSPIHVLSIALSPQRLLIAHDNEEEFDDQFVRTLAVIHNPVMVGKAERYLISSRKLVDGPHTKYSRFGELLRAQAST